MTPEFEQAAEVEAETPITVGIPRFRVETIDVYENCGPELDTDDEAEARAFLWDMAQTWFVSLSILK